MSQRKKSRADRKSATGTGSAQAPVRTDPVPVPLKRLPDTQAGASGSLSVRQHPPYCMQAGPAGTARARMVRSSRQVRRCNGRAAFTFSEKCPERPKEKGHAGPRTLAHLCFCFLPGQALRRIPVPDRDTPGTGPVKVYAPTCPTRLQHRCRTPHSG